MKNKNAYALISILIIVVSLTMSIPTYPLLKKSGEKGVFDVDTGGKYLDDFKVVYNISKISDSVDFEIYKKLDFKGIHPDFITCGENVILVYEKLEDYGKIVICFSSDRGKTWSFAFTLRGKRPRVAVGPDGYGMCVFESDDPYLLYMVEFTDIRDVKSWEISHIDLSFLRHKSYSYSIKNLCDLDICIPTLGTIFIAGVGNIENLSSGYKIHGCPVLIYSRDGGKTFNIVFSEHTPYVGLKKTSLSVDEGIYIAYEVDDSGVLCLYFPDGKIDGGWKDLLLTDRENALYRNPHIYTWDKNVVIVLESMSFRNRDIVYLFSPDSGNSWIPNSIELVSSESNETFPFFSKCEDKFILSFEREGNLYTVESYDLENWNNLKKLSKIDGGIKPYFGFCRIKENSGIVWSEVIENRSAVKFYFMEIGRGKANLRIINDSVKFGGDNNIFKETKNLISICIENSGNESASDFFVSVYIKHRNDDRIIPIAIEKIDYLGARQRMNVSINLFYPTIKSIVDSIVKFVNIEKLILKVDEDYSIVESNEDDNTLVIDVNFVNFFPKMEWIEDMIIRSLEKNTAINDVKEDIMNMLFG